MNRKSSDGTIGNAQPSKKAKLTAPAATPAASAGPRLSDASAAPPGTGTDRSRHVVTTPTANTSSPHPVPMKPISMSDPRYWLSRIRYFGSQVPMPRPKSGARPTKPQAML